MVLKATDVLLSDDHSANTDHDHDAPPAVPERTEERSGERTDERTEERSDERTGGTATAMRPRSRPAPPRMDKMPQWKVLLHNDDVNDIGYVVDTILELTSLTPQMALLRMLEAHHAGLSLLVITHREYAELLQEQFQSKRLSVTIEPA
ncbi:MAG: ATP-dependent Clp protease adaptor ClpS [Phycisphaerales bacterium]|nr:ATP-dependent Clp protease adaptor ClpS [Phycisphaerales bacterium]